MRLIRRNDAALVAGLIAGTVVTFQRPLRFIWESAWEVQERYHVDLLPPLTIFVGVFIYHEARKRALAKAEARAAVVDAAQARQRSAELERLMIFSQALANALDMTTLQQALWRFLPPFAGDRECWVLARRSDRWEPLMRETSDTAGQQWEEREAIADRAVLPETVADAHREGIVDGGVLCFPMVAGAAVGVLGVDAGASMTADERRTLGVASGLVAIAVKNAQLFLEMREHSLLDGLTNCFNRSHGLDVLGHELDRARRSVQPLSILLFDIDHFKTINDELGHLRGDDLLRAVGAQLTRVLRSSDVRCRYGGDEFLIILPDTPQAGAQQVAESVRRKIAALAIVAGGRTLPVTVSVGVATASPGEPGVAALIERADGALYLAKRGGRDRSSVAGAAPMVPLEHSVGPPAAAVPEP